MKKTVAKMISKWDGEIDNREDFAGYSVIPWGGEHQEAYVVEVNGHTRLVYEIERRTAHFSFPCPYRFPKARVNVLKSMRKTSRKTLCYEVRG